MNSSNSITSSITSWLRSIVSFSTSSPLQGAAPQAIPPSGRSIRSSTANARPRSTAADETSESEKEIEESVVTDLQTSEEGVDFLTILPEEVSLLILSFAGRQAQAAIACTCRSGTALANDKSLELQEYRQQDPLELAIKEQDPKKIAKRLKRLSGEMHTVDIHRVVLANYRGIWISNDTLWLGLPEEHQNINLGIANHSNIIFSLYNSHVPRLSLLNNTDKRKMTFLEIAIQENEFAVADELLEVGASLPRLESFSLQDIALSDSKLYVAIKTNPDILSQKDNEGNTILHYFAPRLLKSLLLPKNYLIKLVLSQKNIDFSARNNEGNTPLHLSALSLEKEACLLEFFQYEKLRQAAEENKFDFSMAGADGRSVLDIEKKFKNTYKLIFSNYLIGPSRFLVQKD